MNVVVELIRVGPRPVLQLIRGLGNEEAACGLRRTSLTKMFQQRQVNATAWSRIYKRIFRTALCPEVASTAVTGQSATLVSVAAHLGAAAVARLLRCTRDPRGITAVITSSRSNRSSRCSTPVHTDHFDTTRRRSSKALHSRWCSSLNSSLLECCFNTHLRAFPICLDWHSSGSADSCRISSQCSHEWAICIFHLCNWQRSSAHPHTSK